MLCETANGNPVSHYQFRDSFVINAYCSIDFSKFQMSFIVSLCDGKPLVRTRHNLTATVNCIKPLQLTKQQINQCRN